MDNFGSVVYLDVQKTGSSFISAFLKNNLNIERVSRLRHGRITDEHREDAFYFISVRHPLEQYASLYRYGIEGKGALFKTLCREGWESLYASGGGGFERWLQFMLDSNNAAYFSEGYRTINTNLIGFQSFRFLVLSFRDAITKLRQIQSYDQLESLYRAERVHSFVVRNESLRDDLEQLSESHLRPFLVDVERAKRWLARAPRVNVSEDLDLNLEALSSETMQLLREKERFLFDEFYNE